MVTFSIICRCMPPPVPRCTGRVGVFSILAQGRRCYFTITTITLVDKRTKKTATAGRTTPGENAS